MYDEMASESPIFCYHELDHGSREFRLLRLLPSVEFDSEIHCQLFESSLDNCPSYEAISYVWGDANITVPVQLHDTTRSVTTNLGLALRYLRLAEEERIIWVDALCINQENNPEKNHQVRQMGSIYASAHQVIVWLGEEEDARHAYQSLTEFITKSKGIPSEDSIKIWAGADFADAKMACDSLFARSWWTRMWTLQEVIHDRSVAVYMGSFQIDFDDLCSKFQFYQGIKLVFEKELLGMALSTSVPLVYRKYHRILALSIYGSNAACFIARGRRSRKFSASWEIGLAITIHWVRERQCSDPRDKVYAILGMQGNKAYENLIDYKLSKEDAYATTMAFLLSRGLGVNSLLQVESPKRRITAEGLPSWVPDWSVQQAVVAKTMHLYYWKRMSINNGMLNIPGIYIGLITNVTVVELDFVAIPLDYRSLKLFQYHHDLPRDSHARASEENTASSMDIYNSSWGPHWAEQGDIIIISLLCIIPLVLRRDGDAYMFVGGCWLIDSELQGGNEEGPPNLENDPGFSTIMHGSAWDETKVEDFRIN
jgi:hypothetical protein